MKWFVQRIFIYVIYLNFAHVQDCEETYNVILLSTTLIYTIDDKDILEINKSLRKKKRGKGKKKGKLVLQRYKFMLSIRVSPPKV